MMTVYKDTQALIRRALKTVRSNKKLIKELEAENMEFEVLIAEVTTKFLQGRPQRWDSDKDNQING